MLKMRVESSDPSHSSHKRVDFWCLASEQLPGAYRTPTWYMYLSRLSRLGSPPSGPVPGNEYTSCRNICEESLIVRCAWALVGRGWALAGLRGAAPRRINNYMETSPAPCQLRLPPSCQERRSTREGFDERRAQNLIVLLLS